MSTDKQALLSDEQREAALQALVGSNPTAIIQAANLLSGDSTTTPRLLELLEVESRPASRQGILFALSWHGDVSLWGLMLRILADVQEAPVVRGQAAEGVAYLFYKVQPETEEFELAARTLLKALEDPSLEVRYGVIFALGASRHLSFLPVLEALIEDPTPVPGWNDTIGRKAADAIESLTWGRE
ncbi:HEAT repeat domain-containing protein [Myxococcus hansupus]|uniref:HEAT repeat domain-containing protein n=1 Tax=Pseudomyxococcus hansupus TaxID=1297742 RepID=UPI000A7A83A2|nr:HEAT repeat domain-containing protein [Myxococcus hansupus]